MASFSRIKSTLLEKSFLYVLLIGIFIRLYNSYFTFYINSDGVLYINQAKMIYYNRFDLLSSSGLPNLSNYPFLIAGAFTVLRDWLLAAKSVSFFFGSLTLAPVYLLFRRFFSIYVSSLGTLIYALMPALVSRSADVIRDPIYWFFLASGIYLLSFYNAKQPRLYLILSCLSFLLATWARVEAFLFVGVSSLFLLAMGPRRLLKAFYFLLPVVVIAVIFNVSPVLFKQDLSALSRLSDFADRFTLPLENYQALGDDIEDLKNKIPLSKPQLREFLPKAGNFAWLIALFTIINHFLESFFYPFCLVLLIGIKGSMQRIKAEPFSVCLLIMIIAGCLLLLGHLFTFWNFDARFLVLVIIPIFIFTGYGLDRSMRYMKNKFDRQELSAYVIIFCLILMIGLPKNLYFREKDKLVFKQIGTYVASREQHNPAYISILAYSPYRQIPFYANYSKPELILPQLAFLQEVTGNRCEDLFSHLQKSKTNYFLWEEKFWRSQPYSLTQCINRNHLEELNRWHHSDTGQMILYKVKVQ